MVERTHLGYYRVVLLNHRNKPSTIYVRFVSATKMHIRSGEEESLTDFESAKSALLLKEDIRDCSVFAMDDIASDLPAIVAAYAVTRMTVGKVDYALISFDEFEGIGCKLTATLGNTVCSYVNSLHYAVSLNEQQCIDLMRILSCTVKTVSKKDVLHMVQKAVQGGYINQSELTTKWQELLSKANL